MFTEHIKKDYTKKLNATKIQVQAYPKPWGKT